MGRPTMRDVASTAGVSLKTVSRVINSEDGVRPATAARVERGDRAARLPLATTSRARCAMGAVDDARPRHRGRGQPVLLGDRAGGRGRRPRARLHAHHRLLRGGPRARARARPAPAAPARRRAAARPRRRRPRYLQRELGAETPVVFLDRPPRGIEADTVLLDNPGGARAAIEHLLAHGHRRIACVADRRPLYTAAERLAGYRAALRRRRRARPTQRPASRLGTHDADARRARGRASCSRCRPTADRALHRQQPPHGRRAARAARARARRRARRLRRLRARRPARGADDRRAPRRPGASAGMRRELAFARLDGGDGPPQRRRRRHRARGPRLRGAARA